MAVTRIWPIKGYVGDVISYAANKNKTDISKFSDEEQALICSLHYAENEDKTQISGEQKLLVDGINCDPEFAAEQMMNTKELYGKTDGIVAYHGYISFKPDEVEPKQAQKIAMEIAEKLWGDDYEIIVATHMNAHCIHCHIVINSVSMTDGKKMNENKAMYQKFRQISDEKCLEYGLSVIENPRGKRVPYNVYKAKQKGIKTKYDYMCEAVDYAVERSIKEKDFFRILADKGYIIKNFYSKDKYATIKSQTDKHGVRLVNLGREYTPETIRYRIRTHNYYNAQQKNKRYNDSVDYVQGLTFIYQFKGYEIEESRQTYSSTVELEKFAGSVSKLIVGSALLGTPVISLLFLALLIAGAIAEKNNIHPHPMSLEMNLSQPKIEFISDQIELALTEKLYNFEDVENFIKDKSAELEAMKYERSKVYNRIRRCNNPEQKTELAGQRDRMTNEIEQVRGKLKLAERIIEDRPDLEARTNAEMRLMREWYFPTQQIEEPEKPRHSKDRDAR